MTQLIITAVGPDRPGLVGEVTADLHAMGGNILDTRMVNLRGQFALMILVEVPPDAADGLVRDMPGNVKRIGLTLSITPQSAPAARPTGLPYRLKTYSSDQPGIVARLTQMLRDNGVNIEELSAWQESAAFAGSPLFLTEMRLTVPPTVPLRKLRADLDFLSNELNLDADLEPAE